MGLGDSKLPRLYHARGLATSSRRSFPYFIIKMKKGFITLNDSQVIIRKSTYRDAQNCEKPINSHKQFQSNFYSMGN